MPPTQHTTQVAVIGAGPGGYAAAFLAADLGLQVMLIDQEANPGGVCLYHGCIPSKALLHVAKVLREARHAAAWGITFGEPTIDLGKLVSWKESVVHRLTEGLGDLCKRRRVAFVQGRATLQDAHTLLVHTQPGGEAVVRFAHAILATGSRPAALPNFPLDSPRVLNSTTALELHDVPRTLLVIGGGYIGLELGTVYAALGSQVTVVELTGGLLPGVDRDLVGILAKRLEREFQALLLQTRVVALQEEAQGVRVTFEGPEGQKTEHLFDKVLVAVGRTPNSSGLGLHDYTHRG